MTKIAKIVTAGAAGVPLTLLSAGLAFAQATTTGGTTAAPNTGAGAAAGMNEMLLAASALAFIGGALYLARARRVG